MARILIIFMLFGLLACESEKLPNITIDSMTCGYLHSLEAGKIQLRCTEDSLWLELNLYSNQASTIRVNGTFLPFVKLADLNQDGYYDILINQAVSFEWTDIYLYDKKLKRHINPLPNHHSGVFEFIPKRHGVYFYNLLLRCFDSKCNLYFLPKNTTSVVPVAWTSLEDQCEGYNPSDEPRGRIIYKPDSTQVILLDTFQSMDGLWQWYIEQYE